MTMSIPGENDVPFAELLLEYSETWYLQVLGYRLFAAK